MTESTGCRDLLARILSQMDGDEGGGPVCEELKSHLARCTDCSSCLQMILKAISLCGERAAIPKESASALMESLRREMRKKDLSS